MPITTINARMRARVSFHFALFLAGII